MSLKKRSYTAYSHDERAGPSQHAPFAFYGTPLPAYDPEAQDDGSYVPVWKQTVTDEHGRKRLHGAFTGGWSAGYFNTVGSKEGWTPASFVSSRTNRAQKAGDAAPKQQRPEDFMDEEDLALQAESQKLETADAFAGIGETANKDPKGMFSDLFRSTRETMGSKLLQRMGWKMGQGVGPKVRRMAQGDKSGEAHYFAPENSKLIAFDRKNDRYGLGFSAEARLDDNNDEADANSDDDASILKRSRSKPSVKPGKLKKKSGIGIGVLNDTGSDEDDSYSVGPSLSYNRVVGGGKKKKKGLGAAPNTESNHKVKSTTNTSQRPQRCHDGRPPLVGFILSLQPLKFLTESVYSVPSLPEGWKSAKSNSKPTPAVESYQTTADAAKTSTLDVKSRAALLGEQQLPGKSIFDFIAPHVRDKLAAASGKTNLPQGRGESAPEDSAGNRDGSRRTLWDLVPPLQRETAVAALQRMQSGFTPYEDEAKRGRYRYFLELRAGLQHNLPERPKGLNLEEWGNEFKEFAQAAAVFKPMSGLMALRFTTSSGTNAGPDGNAQEPLIEEDPAENAAKNGMFGALTRQTLDFHPTRLLCKRFGVPPPATVAPDPASGPSGRVDSARGLLPADGSRDIVNQHSIDLMLRDRPSNSQAMSGFSSEPTQLHPIDQYPEALAEVDAERNEALEASRPDAAVFKSVFGDDDVEE